MILYGSAGNGKTLFTKVLARECDLPVYIVDTADAKDESSIMQQIKNAFDKANDSDKCSVVFSTKSTSSCLTLTVISSIRAQNDTCTTFNLNRRHKFDEQRVFVATCNDFDDLPASWCAPVVSIKNYVAKSRLRRKKRDCRKYMFATKCEFEMSVEDIAELTQGLSCSAIETLINACVLESDAKTSYRRKRFIKTPTRFGIAISKRIFRRRKVYEKLL